MILAAALDIAISLLLVAHVVVSLLLILIVLMQRPKQEGLGAAFGGGTMDSILGAGTTSVLQKGTAYFGTAFLVFSLILAILIGKRNYQAGLEAPPEPETPAAMAPEIPEVDVTPASPLDAESLREELEGAVSEPVQVPPLDAAEGDDAAASEANSEPSDPAEPENGTPADDGVDSETTPDVDSAPVEDGAAEATEETPGPDNE